jgi:hypothetical protein
VGRGSLCFLWQGAGIIRTQPVLPKHKRGIGWEKSRKDGASSQLSAAAAITCSINSTLSGMKKACLFFEAKEVRRGGGRSPFRCSRPLVGRRRQESRELNVEIQHGAVIESDQNYIPDQVVTL